MYCKKCGNNLSGNANFCEKCGKYIKAPVSANINKDLSADEQYESISWRRKSKLNSWFIFLGWFIFPPFLYFTIYNLISGDIYYNKIDAEGNLKKWSRANKILAWMLLGSHILWIASKFT
jgi:uncharacterized membrane protein YvbJ